MNAKPVLTAAVSAALNNVAASPSTAMNKLDVPVATEAVVRQISPTLEHLANAEPWYRSRVTWGAIVSIGLPALGALGVATDWIDQETAISVAMAVGSAVGGLITLYGRWKAKRPIGA
jgi:drug/metabolite transporter (DMT)-like permease